VGVGVGVGVGVLKEYAVKPGTGQREYVQPGYGLGIGEREFAQEPGVAGREPRVAGQGEHAQSPADLWGGGVHGQPAIAVDGLA
jgi:hypothetical protein